MSTPKNGSVWSCAIDYGVITGTGAHLELVNGSQWIDTGHSAIFQTENDRFVILSCIAHILTHQHEIGLERSATYKWNERRKWLTNGIKLMTIILMMMWFYLATLAALRNTVMDTLTPVSVEEAMVNSLNSACSTRTSQSPRILRPRKYFDLNSPIHWFNNRLLVAWQRATELSY